MRLYRVHFRCDGGSSAGYEFFTNNEEARRRAREHNRDLTKEQRQVDYAEVDYVEFDLSKQGVLTLLNRVASSPNNG